MFAACHGVNSPAQAEMCTIPLECCEPLPAHLVPCTPAHPCIDEAQRRARRYAGSGAEQGQNPELHEAIFEALSRMFMVPSDLA